MSLLPWKVEEPKTETIAGLDIPDYGSTLIDESMVLSDILDMEKKGKINKAQSALVWVAYCLAYRFKKTDHATGIANAVSKKDVTEKLNNFVLEIVPKHVQKQSLIQELFDFFLGSKAKTANESGKSEGKELAGQKHSGNSSSTTRIAASLPLTDTAGAQPTSQPQPSELMKMSA